MKILLTLDNPYESDNPYFRELIDNIKKIDSEIEFDWGIKKFWANNSFDIVHIMFPHFLLKIGDKNEEHSLEELELRLQVLKNKNIKIVSTCHNIVPHYKSNIEQIQSYDCVYRYSEHIYHLGDYSRGVFEKKYPNANNLLLEHPVYNDLYTEFPSREKALKKLKLSSKYKYILCIGAFRDDEERKLICKIVKSFKKKKIKILAPLFCKIKFKKNIVSLIKEVFTYLRYKILFKRIVFTGKSVSDTLLSYYMSVSDVSLIQRVKILNSGSLPLNYYFGNVVVGPNVGNVGEILKKTGNPTFDVTDLNSLPVAIRAGFDLFYMGLGSENKKIAEKNWLIKHISDKQISYYKLLKISGWGGVNKYILDKIYSGKINYSFMHSSLLFVKRCA